MGHGLCSGHRWDRGARVRVPGEGSETTGVRGTGPGSRLGEDSDCL